MVSLSRIAEVSGGVVEGDPDFEVSSVQSLEIATSGSLSFCVNPLKDSRLAASRAGAMILAPEHSGHFSGNKILASDPYLAFAKCSKLFKPEHPAPLHPIHPTAIVDDSVVIGDNVSVGAYSTIEGGVQIADGVSIGKSVNIGPNARIGKDSTIRHQVVIGQGSQIGERCFISAGAIIGSSGFGYAQEGDSWHKIEQLGSVVLGNDVDIGSNTTVDRGALGNTVIHDGVKIDNLVQIAHNVEIGENTIIAGCVGIAGSAKIGKRCKLAGGCGISGHLEIADDVTILAVSLVSRSISQPGAYGSMVSVQPFGQWRRNAAIIHRLDKLAKTVAKLARKNTDAD